MYIIRSILIFLSFFFIVGCMTAAQHQESVKSSKEREITVGTVQKEIRKGMSGAEVAEVLGSPNIVSTDSEGREVWIYDKISSDVTYSKDSGGLFLLVTFFNRSAGSQSSTQKTLTIIIKYDKDKKVRDFAYHSSKF